MLAALDLAVETCRTFKFTRTPMKGRFRAWKNRYRMAERVDGKRTLRLIGKGMNLKDWLRAFGSPKSPLEGIALDIVERPSLRLLPAPGSEVEELEIGATGPGELQFVLISARRRATVKLSVEQARWLAGALKHWADRSETIPLH